MNPIAMICGFLFVALISNLPNDIARFFGASLHSAGWFPIMEFPWWICFGTIVTFLVAVIFRDDRAGTGEPPGENGSSGARPWSPAD